MCSAGGGGLYPVNVDAIEEGHALGDPRASGCGGDKENKGCGDEDKHEADGDAEQVREENVLLGQNPFSHIHLEGGDNLDNLARFKNKGRHC